MDILSSPHCHTTYVDGKSTAEEVVRAAIAKGFVSLGFSEHGPQKIDASYSLSDERIPDYIAEIRGLTAKYADDIRIYLGMERDIVSHGCRKDFDYILGASHYLMRGDEYCAVDGPAQELVNFRDKYYGGDGAQMAMEYYGNLGDYALSYKPDIIAHFDLIQKRNRDKLIFDYEDDRVINCQYAALDKILASGALLEVNTGGMARSAQPWPYPDAHILARWRALGGRVIVGSDCHFAPDIAYAYDIAKEYIKNAGFKSAWRLGGRGEPLFTEFAI